VKKRSYRKIPVKQFQLDAVTAAIPVGKVVLAIDVAKVDMVAAFADGRGEVVKIVAWKNPDENAELLALLRALQAAGYMVEAVMESSGTYGDVLRYQLEALDVPVFRVSGKRTHDASEVYDGVPSLHDAKCAAILAKLHVDDISARWLPATDDKRNLRAAVDLMDLHQERYLQLVHRLESWLARHWPELPALLDLTTASLLALIGRCGGPRDVAADPEAARRLLHGMSHGLMDQNKIDQVVDSASRSVGIPLLDRERDTLMAVASEAGRSLRAFTAAKTQLEKLSLQTYAQRMAPTVGKTTAAIMATFVGDPALFPSAAAYAKACGLNLKEKSSGTLKGHLKITKRGPGRARQFLWLAVCRWIRTDAAARAWFERKVARDAGKKSKALVALMRKLALALFHIGRGDPYEPARLFDLERLGLAT